MSRSWDLTGFFLREGYARLPGTLPDHLVDEAASVVDRLFADPHPPHRVNAKGEVSRIDGLLDRDPIFLEILRSPLILEPLSALLGPNIEVVRHRHNHATLNRRGDIPYRLHRDIQNWSRALVSVFIYLEPATVEGGCTHVVPGSHHIAYAGPQSGGGGGNWADEHREYATVIGQELPAPMPLGGVLLLNALTFHSVGENRTPGSRKSMVFACHSSDDLRDDQADDSRVLLVGQRKFNGNPALRVSGSLEVGPSDSRTPPQDEDIRPLWVGREVAPGPSRSRARNSRELLDVTGAWPEVARRLVSVIDDEWHASDRACFWAKDADGTLVSDFEVRVDLATRLVLSHYFPDMPVLSEELGWLRSSRPSNSNLAAVLDPVDGTESLSQGAPSWWVSIAICESLVPVLGLVYQPFSGVTHDSRRPSARRAELTGLIGLSPDQMNARSGATDRLRRAGFETIATPHAVEKVVSVLDGRCDAAIYIPSSKSPDWRAWDVAAGISLAESNDLPMRVVSGKAFCLHDLSASFTESWICARDDDVWHAVRSAVGEGLDAAE